MSPIRGHTKHCRFLMINFAMRSASSERIRTLVALKLEISRTRRLHFETSRADDDGPDLPEDSYGLTGLIIYFQKLMGRLVATDAAAARAQVAPG